MVHWMMHARQAVHHSDFVSQCMVPVRTAVLVVLSRGGGGLIGARGLCGRAVGGGRRLGLFWICGGLLARLVHPYLLPAAVRYSVISQPCFLLRIFYATGEHQQAQRH